MRRAVSRERVSNRKAPSAHGRKNRLLDVRVRRSTATRFRRRKIMSWVFTISAWVILLGASAYSIQMLIDRFFLSNPEYDLKTVRLSLDGVLTRDEALEVTGFAEGTNIFRLDLAGAERRLRAIPDVSDARIERILPGTLAIRIEARDPVAWISAGPRFAADEALLIDESRFYYRPRRSLPEYFHLPIIYGVRLTDIQAGDPLHRDELDAVLALLREVGDRVDADIVVRSVDVSKGWCMDVTTDRGTDLTFSTENLGSQLDRLEKLLEYCDTYNRRLKSANLIPSRNIPVRFAMAAETATATANEP